MSKLTLVEWAADHFRTPPSSNTLRKWAREGRITPPPIKHGRNYYVEPIACYREPEKLRTRTSAGSLIERIQVERAKLGL
ncbi:MULTISPECIES: excisionase [unclassified Pseudomonas]|uniref:excisionase n=1 Tax=unclassified Pseudomonas TaxID=196821 RepID=UPI000C8694AA|nr:MULTISPECIES: excisionase [unclassified Pseudomonas]PMV79482.1 excisionase [Pseudomonas sp. GW101-1A09]PMV86856.1 excisionase [Pseudomonas sp. FW306-2-2C-B10A]PMV98334.1 excisionase [Pseudomonas sp. GW460-C8]PMV98981.1 excisionase [Pseudomonas sp. MPR-TSA4]PMW06655.1 excisionase [Pseudomonas sp. FW306-2-1A-C05A]